MVPLSRRLRVQIAIPGSLRFLFLATRLSLIENTRVEIVRDTHSAMPDITSLRKDVMIDQVIHCAHRQVFGKHCDSNSHRRINTYLSCVPCRRFRTAAGKRSTCKIFGSIIKPKKPGFLDMGRPRPSLLHARWVVPSGTMHRDRRGGGGPDWTGPGCHS